MRRQAKQWSMTAADPAALRGLVKRASRLSAKGSPELESVRGQIRAALLSGDGGRSNLAHAGHLLDVARIAKDGPDPETAVEYLAEAAEAFAALILDLRSAS